MAEETPPPPAAEPEPVPAPAGESTEAKLARLEERMDDVEAVAETALLMHVEDDVDEPSEPERTEVVDRHEPPPAEKKEEATAPAQSSDRHAGLFL